MKLLYTLLFFAVFFSCVHAVSLASVHDTIQGTEQSSDSTLTLEELVVSAYHIDSRISRVPGSLSVLSGEDIQVGDGNNFAHALHAVPGIYMHSGTYATSRVIIRGVGSRTPYNTNRVKSYLNDIPITSSDGISSPENVDLLGISRMEVIKGPASALYGSGLGGNINLYTPSGMRDGLRASLQHGSYQTTKAAVGGSYQRGDLGLWGNASRVYSDGFRENNHFKRTSLLSSGAWKQPSYSVSYTLLLMELDAGIPSSIGKTVYETNPRAAATNWNEVKGYKAYQRAIGGVTLTNRLMDRWENRFTLFGRWTDSYERRPFNNLDDGTSGGGVRNRLRYHGNKWDALLGLEWMNDAYHWEMELDGELINKNRERRNHTNLFGMVYWRPDKRWNISVGGAVNKVDYRLTDLFSENGDQGGRRSFPWIFSPRIGVNYAPSVHVALYTSAGHGFSMPSPEETLLPGGDINESLKPEQGMQYEAGVRLSLFNNATRLETTVYLIDLNDLLVTKRVSEDIFTGINAGRTRHGGLELTLQQRVFQFPTFPGSLQINANYTYSKNTFIDFEDDGNKYDGNVLPGVPAHMTRGVIRWQPTLSWLLEAHFQHVGSQYMNDANTVKNDAYSLGDIKATYKIPAFSLGEFELFVGINNITNTYYAPMLTVNALAFGNDEPRYYYPGMPRHYYAGINWQF